MVGGIVVVAGLPVEVVVTKVKNRKDQKQSPSKKFGGSCNRIWRCGPVGQLGRVFITFLSCI